MTTEKMTRVSRAKPCPVCGRSDWCLVAEDGSAAICARISDGSVKKCGDAGHLHILVDRHNRHDGHRGGARWRHSVTVGHHQGSQSQNFEQISGRCRSQLTEDRLHALACSLGLSAQSLRRLRVGWDGRAFTFPMSDASGTIIGIRRRFPNGAKVSVKGSRTGLFISIDLAMSGALLLCEGTTDTAAALDLGFDAIGRPSCRGAMDMIARAAKGRAEVVVVGDNDEVGKQGATELADALALHYRVKVVFPPTGIKDLRAWLLQGLTGEELQRIIDRTPPVELSIESGGARP